MSHHARVLVVHPPTTVARDFIDYPYFADLGAVQLALEERAQLADRLITSLFDDQDIEEAWAVEVERRIKDIESGRAKLIPASEAIARAPAAIE